MTVILAVGDVGVKRAAPQSMFAGCTSALQAGQLRFAQLETTISERGARVPNAKLAMRAPPAMAAAARAAGFDVMSFAGNHCLDWGYDAFDDTFRHAAQAGIALCGAGQTLAEARRPLQMSVDGLQVALLAASSILPEGYAAARDRPGCAPLRAHTLYEQIEPDQPATPARVRTHAHRDDLAALLAAIGTARASADVVLVSLHWGIHMVPSVLAEYQREVAHAAIVAGADAILGHHPHLLKGIEIYRERPIFYSLGNFAIEQPHVWDPAIVQSDSFRHLVSLNPQWQTDHLYMLPEVTRLTGIAKLEIDRSGRIEARFLPAWIDDDSAPQMLSPAEQRFTRVIDFLERSSRDAQLASRFKTEGGELRILPA